MNKTAKRRAIVELQHILDKYQAEVRFLMNEAADLDAAPQYREHYERRAQQLIERQDQRMKEIARAIEELSK